MGPRVLLSTFAMLAVLFFPEAAFGQEPGQTTIIPPAVPPPTTDWVTLVAIGTGYTFAIVALLRQAVPKIDGRLVPLVVLPIAAAVALYQVGYADLKLTAKHAGLLYLSAYGGAAGIRKLGRWALDAWKAYQAGDTIPPPPPIGSDGPQSAAPTMPKSPPRLPPTLGGMLCLAALALAGCASPIYMAAAVNNVAADSLNEAAPRLQRHCIDEVATLAPAAAVLARRDECEPLTLAYDGAAAAVVALRAALLAAAGGDASGLSAAVALVVSAAGELATKMGGLQR